MTIFTIDSENHIAAHGSASEVTDKECEPFTSETELAQLAADWPGNRLVDIWNRIPGLTPVQRFTNRAVATARIWRAVESLVAGEPSGDVAPAPRHWEAPAQATPARRPKEHQTSPSGGPAETLQRRHPAAPDARNRLAGAQRARLHLRHLGQEAEPQDRVLQDRSR